MSCTSATIRLSRAVDSLRIVGAITLAWTMLAPSPALAVGLGKVVSDVCQKTTDAAFRAKYCTAAKDYQKGYVANRSTAAVWTGVAAVCGSVCGKALGSLVCRVSSTGGSAGEGILTQKFTDSLLGAGQKWGVDAVAKKASGESVTGATGKVDVDACTTAGTSALKAYEKFSNSKQNEKSLVELRTQTQGMNTPVNQTGFVLANEGAITANTPETPNRDAVSAQTGNACDEAALGTALGTLRCAAHSDPSLPPYATSEEFLRDLQTVTGKTPDLFFGGFVNPGESLLESKAVAGLPAAQQTGVAESLVAIEQYASLKTSRKNDGNRNVPPNGGGHRPFRLGDSEDELDVQEILAGALGAMAREGESATESGADENPLIANARRPASLISPENRAVSIFDRVKWRYGAITKSARLEGNP